MKNAGEFRERSAGFFHWYADATESEHGGWVRLYNLPHLIETSDGYRLARVLKTVAYIAIDEDAEGRPVLEKWHIGSHRRYTPE